MKDRTIQFKSIGVLILMAIFALAITSCQKSALSPDILDKVAPESGDDYKDSPGSRCMVTHLDDDLFGYSLDIFYNEAGNPDSMSFAGFPVKIKYDNKGRLVKANFGTDGVHHDYLYNGRSSQPAVLNYYYPGITYPVNTGLIGVDSFQYNIKGEMIKRGINNLLFPEYNSVETYEYNNEGNVTKVSITAQNGGTVFMPGYVMNEAFSYDQKRNFMAGNRWLKFILRHSEVFVADHFRMYSKNNPLEWTWGFDGGYNPISAEYIYSDEGFANTVNLHLFDIDGVTELFPFTENASSTCDDSEEKLQQAPSQRTGLLPRNLYNLPGTLPLTTAR